MIRLLIVLALFALPVRAEQVVAALSQDRVSISTSFDGSEILVYGAIKRNGPPASDAPLAVIITIEGPDEAVTVRRKDRRLGIWVNVEGVDVARAPSFYAVATSSPLERSLTGEDDRRWQITPGLALSTSSTSVRGPKAAEFLAALIRVREAAGLYLINEETVLLRDDTLFSTTIALPADLTEGNYDTRIFLTRGGVVVDSFGTSLFVHKVGLERWIYNLAHDQPLIYGLLSLFIAIAAGWGASALFRLAQR